MAKAAHKALSARIPLFEIFPSHLQRRMRRLRLRLGKLVIDRLLDGDPIALDIHEEIAPLRPPGIHLADTMPNEVHRRPKLLRHRPPPDNPVRELTPIVDDCSSPL